jgi:2-polyprenyl-3-methyl-5-hydroxy-6-metoxy-1,4-benzoquinol methylase
VGPSTVLDVGCGTGEHTIYLSALGYDVYGLDSSPRAVEQARANAAARNVEVHFQVDDDSPKTIQPDAGTPTGSSP